MVNELLRLTVEPITFALSGVERAQLGHHLLHWFQSTAKVPLPDLDARVKDFQRRLLGLAGNLELRYTPGLDGAVEVVATGDHAATLHEVEHGSLWFDGWDHVAARLLAAITP